MKKLIFNKITVIVAVGFIITATSTLIMSKNHHSFHSETTSVDESASNVLSDTTDSKAPLTIREKEMKEHDDLMEKTRLFNDELKQLLLKDGYVKDVNNIECVSYGADGIVEVCGAKLTRADKKKYQALHHKYFNRGHFSETKTE